MVNKFNILITAASRRVAMIRGFTTALRELGISGAVHVTDTDKNSPGLRFCDKAHLVPLSTSDGYIQAILEICEKENINLVIPTIDEELPVFGANKEKFKAIGVIPLVSDENIGDICNDKHLTASFFDEHAFPFVKTYLPHEIDFASIKYPLFIKPRVGRGSVSAYPVHTETQLRFFLDYVKNPVVQDYLDGAEYTVDALIGLDGKVLSVVPRERLVIRSGVCDRGRTRKNMKLITLCRDICEKLGVIGPVNLQCKVNRGKISFFEINPRFSGAIQLTVAAGADFFKMIVKDAIGEGQEPAIGEFTDNLMMMSYEESIFEENGHNVFSGGKITGSVKKLS
ncbi:hypothetical protein MNBD_NITROSPINAE01-1128 [hydrothermal vent metagenome]|uniref:ATP-grasp domain-containing protein n=1 Tax=hydrothermal vent metagenome TaxID=652676 RepID=A0A3B1BZ81_9ZZZZ